MLYPAELRARLAANGEGGYLADEGTGGKGRKTGFPSCRVDGRRKGAMRGFRSRGRRGRVASPLPNSSA